VVLLHRAQQLAHLLLLNLGQESTLARVSVSGSVPVSFTPQLMILDKGSTVRTADLARGDAGSSSCFHQHVLDSAGESGSKVSYMEVFSQPFFPPGEFVFHLLLHCDVTSAL
jgi:hypothetical protein